MWSSDEDSEEPARKIPRFKNRREYEEPQEFRERFRFTPSLFEKLMTEIGEFLEPEHYGRHLHSLTSRQKLLAALRFYASGHFYYSLGDTQGNFYC